MDWNKLISGKILVQIAFGQFNVQLQFHEGLTIMISDTIYLSLFKDLAKWTPELKFDKIELFLYLLNKEVISANFKEKSGLVIEFEDAVLTVPKPDDDYEYLHFISDTEGIYIY